MPAKAMVPVDVRPSIDRFRGHGPLLHSWHIRGPRHINRGINKGPSPCWYATRPSRPGPSAREAAMARSASGGPQSPHATLRCPLRRARRHHLHPGQGGGHGRLLRHRRRCRCRVGRLHPRGRQAPAGRADTCPARGRDARVGGAGLVVRGVLPGGGGSRPRPLRTCCPAAARAMAHRSRPGSRVACCRFEACHLTKPRWAWSPRGGISTRSAGSSGTSSSRAVCESVSRSHWSRAPSRRQPASNPASSSNA